MRKQSEIIQYAGLGFELALNVLVGFGVGYWIDQKFGCVPYAMIAGAMFGIISGIWGLIRRFVPKDKPKKE